MFALLSLVFPDQDFAVSSRSLQASALGSRRPTRGGKGEYTSAEATSRSKVSFSVQSGSHAIHIILPATLLSLPLWQTLDLAWFADLQFLATKLLHCPHSLRASLISANHARPHPRARIAWPPPSQWAPSPKSVLEAEPWGGQ